MTDWYKCGEKILVKLEVLGNFNFQFQTLSSNKEEAMRIFEVSATLLTLHIVCTTGSWTNVKNYFIYIVDECERVRWRNCICLVKFLVTITMDDWEQACVNFDTAGNYVHVYILYTKY